MTDDRFTCLVPTHNRPHFLRRLLRFYGEFPPGFALMVLDSSNRRAAAENLATINDWKSELEIAYRHFDLNFIDKCARGLELVHTPCVAFCADDDLLFPDSVLQCVEFIRDEPAYAAAMGRTVQLNADPSWRHGNGLRVLKGYSIEDDGSLDRCRQMASQLFSSFYAVYRTQTLRDNFRITAANTDPRLSFDVPETLLSQLSVLRGKLKVLPLMYSIRERHHANDGASMRNGARPEAESHYQRLERCLTNQFSQQGIDIADAKRFVEHWLGFLRNPSFTIRRPRRSAVELLCHTFRGIAERVADNFWTDQARHCRSLRASDLAGCEPIWHASVQLIRNFPDGIPSDISTVERCA